MKSLSLFILLSLFMITTGAGTVDQSTIYNFHLKDIDGNDVALSSYKTKVILIVNVASECGYTSQYEGLEQLYKKYKDRGLTIFGVPANNFGGQEPGTNAEIKSFCSTKFKVTFPMFSKVSVLGNDIDPLYKLLTADHGAASPAGDVKWNFEKFLISKDGKVLHRFRSRMAPNAPELTTAIEEALK